MPATGPVSAGGDQGKDFETFHTYLQSTQIANSTFIGLASDKTIAFTCSLQRKETIIGKIKSDVTTIMTSGSKVDVVYFFCSADIPTSRRHKLRTWARENYSIELEILDGQAISVLLADPEVFWIAERYLGISSLTEKPQQKERIKELINEALKPIYQGYKSYRLPYFEKKDFYIWWRYSDSKLEIVIDPISLKDESQKILEDFSGEEQIKLIIKHIEDYNGKILEFKELLKGIIENVMKEFDFTHEELSHSQITDELKWRYVQWTVGKSIHAPKDSLKTFYDKHISEKIVKNELKIFKDKVKLQDEVNRIHEEIELITLSDVNKLKELSEYLERKTKEYMRATEAAIDHYRKIHDITIR